MRHYRLFHRPRQVPRVPATRQERGRCRPSCSETRQVPRVERTCLRELDFRRFAENDSRPQIMRVIFRLLFTLPLVVLGVDGVLSHHTVNESA
jgi:hypothetical protein